jgi:hypothetical protein
VASRPQLPSSFLRPDLEATGFEGWRTWDALREAEYPVPVKPLCYVIYRPSSAAPAFLDANPGGRFKGRDPTVPAPTLAAKWVTRAHAVNIGKANVGRSRLKTYARFGAGDPVAHWGGRYIWQLADADELLVAWHEVGWQETARDYEKRLLALFRHLHEGRLPFANLVS